LGGLTIHKAIYTTNAIEAFHPQLRKVNKTKGSFTSDGAMIKLLYLIQGNITAKRQKPMHNWNRINARLSVLFDDRL
jgi:transposase-like protein